jgi:hypothetical protein
MKHITGSGRDRKLKFAGDNADSIYYYMRLLADNQ